MKYHVFLSFRGIDTRKNFTDHLYSALLRKGIVTFRDNEDLERGEVISEKLVQAIEQSLLAIVVLSKNYASSSWCLDELLKIVESKQELGQTVFPVFYDVDPSDIRRQKRNFSTALHQHKVRFSDDKVRKWSEALTNIANLSGWDARDKHEGEIVEDIVKSVWNKLCFKLPSNFKHLVGDIQSKVDRIISLLKVGLDDKCIIGIWGMGKTTLARVVYGALRSKFDACCFLANVREDSERFGLVYLQKKLLSCVQLGEQKINDSYDGAEVLGNFLCHKKVLIVLDDVNHRSQLDNLARNEEWFGAGTKIMITTRDLQLLRQYEQFEEYEVRGLHQDESLKLLCQKAFKKDEPRKGYLDLSKEVVEYACGLPLALEVLGSFLCRRNQSEWRDTLDKLRQNLHKDIFNPLRISYDGLEDEEYKIIFLDIACFFNRKPKDEVTNILTICGLHPIIGTKVLIEKSLLSFHQLDSGSMQKAKEHFYMHDLLQEMGRNIVLQESPVDPGRRSRLWSLEEIDFVLKRNKGTEKVQSIFLDLSRHFEANWHPNCFAEMPNVRLLNLSRVHLSHVLNSLPNALKYLRWDYYVLEFLPSIDQLYELESLQLFGSKIKKLWNGSPSLYKLRIINLSDSKDIIETPDFSGTPNLEKLLLNHCEGLVRVHESVGQLKKLVQLGLENCKNLVTLPSYVEMNNLEVFILDGCVKVEKLPEFGRNMTSLCFLDVSETSIVEVPPSIIHLINLKNLDLSFCHRLKSMPELPPNLIICARCCAFLEPISTVRYLYASHVSKYRSVLPSPTHLVYDYSIDDFGRGWGWQRGIPGWFKRERGIPRWFERRENRENKDKSCFVVTIIADIPCEDGYEGECWAIAVALNSLDHLERFFSINWEFQDYCNSDTKKRHGTSKIFSRADENYRLVYVGFYPFDKDDCRPHPSGVGSQLHLKLSFSLPNIATDDSHKAIYHDFGGCGWRLIRKKDFEAWSSSSIPYY